MLATTAIVWPTSLSVDEYGLPADLPGMATRPAAPAQGVRHVEAAIDGQMADSRFRAHLSLHEFEALLYTDPEACGLYPGGSDVARVMAEAVSQCGGPELVNDHPVTLRRSDCWPPALPTRRPFTALRSRS